MRRSANYYCQAINDDAPHPFAARLWQEFLYSDEGQLLWLKGYSHPVRFQDMSDRGVVPQDLLDALPSADLYANIEFPTPAAERRGDAERSPTVGTQVAG